MYYDIDSFRDPKTNKINEIGRALQEVDRRMKRKLAMKHK